MAKTILDLAQQVSTYLGSDWSVESWCGYHGDQPPLTDRAYLCVEREGWRLYFAQGKPGRIEVRGLVDDTRRGPGFVYPNKAPVITVARYREAEMIAREITRRLLPIYKGFFNGVEAAYLDWVSRSDAEYEIMTMLAEVSHGRIPEYLLRCDRSRPEVKFGKHSEFDWPCGEVGPLNRGRLDMTLYGLLPVEAEQVIELLIQLRKMSTTTH